MIFFFSFLPFLYGRGLCPNANQPQPRTQFITSPGFPRGASRGGQCKYELKVNYGSFIKLEKITSNIKCIPGKGVTAVEMVNVQGTFKSGDVAPASRFASKSFCKGRIMPPFGSSDVQLEIIVDYSTGDSWKIGYKSVTSKSGPTIPRTKPKLTTRRPPVGPVTQMPPWTPPPDHYQQNHHNQQNQNPNQAFHPGQLPHQTPYAGHQFVNGPGPAPGSQYTNYGQSGYNYPDYGQQLQPMEPSNYGVHHELPPSNNTPKSEKRGSSKLIMVFGTFGIVVIIVAAIGGGLWFRQKKMGPAESSHIPMK